MAAHEVGAFQRITLNAPSIEVATADGYDPTLGEIVAFVNNRA
jgi:hypothetical protein